jgi:hypothetical protein
MDTYQDYSWYKLPSKEMNNTVGIRHPANGGKTDFVSGINKYIV